jgi:predicted lactoylglutathione lyase
VVDISIQAMVVNGGLGMRGMLVKGWKWKWRNGDVDDHEWDFVYCQSIDQPGL